MGLKWSERQAFRRIGKGDVVRLKACLSDGVLVFARTRDLVRVVEVLHDTLRVCPLDESGVYTAWMDQVEIVPTSHAVQVGGAPNLDAYHALVLEADRQQLPEHYRSDLVNLDKKTLRQQNAPQRFTWILHEWGTWLQTDWDNIWDRHSLYYRFRSQDKAHYYIWEDYCLREVSQLECINAIRQWRNPNAKPYATWEEAWWYFQCYWLEYHRPEEIAREEAGYTPDAYRVLGLRQQISQEVPA